MTGKTHIAGGLLAGSALLYGITCLNYDVPPLHGLCILAGNVTGALAPDVDEVHSTAGRKLKIISFPLTITHGLFYLLTFFLPKKSKIRYNIASISRATGHRGMMHWPTTILVLCGAFYLLTQLIFKFLTNNTVTNRLLLSYIIGFALGMLSHLAYDLVSGKIALLAPFNNIRIGITLFPTGGFFDRFIIRTISNVTSIVFLINILNKYLTSLYDTIINRLGALIS